MVYIVNTNELYHHGVMGQKWGVRRYQNEDGSLKEAGRKHYARLLNKLDTKRVNYAYNYDRLARKNDKLQAKANRAEFKGKDDKAQEIREKAQLKYGGKMKSYKDAVKSIDKKTKEIVNDALANNMNVKMSTVRKVPTKVAVGMMVAGGLTGALLGATPGTQAAFRANATHYKVKKGSGKLLDNRKRIGSERLSDTREDRAYRWV